VYQIREGDQTRTPTAPSQAAIAEGAPLEQGGEDVICRVCQGFVAHPSARTEINGRSEHTFINQAGLIFRVGCFRDAPGVFAFGEESEHWTWFAGFSWRASLCQGCHEHLGWCYRSPDAGFTALILDKVRERGAPGHAS